MTVAHPSVGEIDFMQAHKVVDYGDASIDIKYRPLIEEIFGNPATKPKLANGLEGPKDADRKR